MFCFPSYFPVEPLQPIILLLLWALNSVAMRTFQYSSTVMLSCRTWNMFSHRDNILPACNFSIFFHFHPHLRQTLSIVILFLFFVFFLLSFPHIPDSPFHIYLIAVVWYRLPKESTLSFSSSIISVCPSTTEWTPTGHIWYSRCWSKQRNKRIIKFSDECLVSNIIPPSVAQLLKTLGFSRGRTKPWEMMQGSVSCVHLHHTSTASQATSHWFPLCFQWHRMIKKFLGAL